MGVEHIPAPKYQWARSLRAVSPFLDIKLVGNARELGYTLHYTRLQSRHTQRERHNEACARLRRLVKKPAPLDAKTMLRRYARQKALHATECYVVGLVG